MKLWRIAAETRKYAATDLSGGGAAANPGRWNDDKEPVVYCAPTIAIAERAADLIAGRAPLAAVDPADPVDAMVLASRAAGRNGRRHTGAASS